METELRDNASDEKDQKSVSLDNGEMIQGLLDFSGNKILDKILEWDNPPTAGPTDPPRRFFLAYQKNGRGRVPPDAENGL